MNQEYLYSWNTKPYNLLSILEGERKSIKILELGCGRGHLSNYLKEKGFNPIAIDFNDISLKISRQIYLGLQLICADANKLPFNDNEFDIVISVELLEHLPNLNRHILEVKRVLKTGGKYMITTPNKLVEIIYNFIRGKNQDLHLNSQSLVSLKKLLVKFGFQPTFYPMIKMPPSQIRKINCPKLRKIAVNFPLFLIPKVFQLSLNCVAKVTK